MKKKPVDVGLLVNQKLNQTIVKINGGKDHGEDNASSLKRYSLALACLWPLILLALYASSAPPIDVDAVADMAKHQKMEKRDLTMETKLRSILDRVDVMGYGPSHPRVAVIIVGDDLNDLRKSTASVFSNTDMNRIFVVTVMVDGMEEDAEFVSDLEEMAGGSVPHWHGLRPDVHDEETEKKEKEKNEQQTDGKNDKDEDVDDRHGKKVQVFFNPDKMGIAACRADGAEFIQMLEQKHENAGVKSPEEDIILLLLQSGAQLETHQWLPTVTQVLIVPPPIVAPGTSTKVAMKLANAVAFNVEGPGKLTSFDENFAPILSTPTAADINLSSGTSYPTPALNNAGVAMRLDTYLNLPAQDTSLEEMWPANLDLALNLWMCGDGIDLLTDLTVRLDEPQKYNEPLQPELAARFAAAWMDIVTSNRYYDIYQKSFSDISFVEWQVLIAKARSTETFPKDITQKCRSFDWYAREVNTDLLEPLLQAEEERKKQLLEEKKNKPKQQIRRGKGSDEEEEEEDGEEEPPKFPGNNQDDDAPKFPGNNQDDDAPKFPGNNQDDDAPLQVHDDTKAYSKSRNRPSKPLRKENLNIIRKADLYDISYVDVSGGHKSHPHKGAKDEDGNWGYIFDERRLIDNWDDYKFTWDEDKLQKACDLRDNHWKMLTKKVYVDFEYDERMANKKRDKIFCSLYTIDAGHKRVPAIQHTWGKRCDGFMVASNLTDEELGTVNIPHEGPESYENMWQKVRSMHSYIYDNYYEDYDWFHIGGDDFFLMLENFREYLESDEIRTAANGGIYLPTEEEHQSRTHEIPLYLGRRFKYGGDVDKIFNSGGSGYTLNKAALKMVVVDILPKHGPHARTFSEDTMIGNGLREHNILAYDTKDDAGGERYMPFMPGHHYGYKIPPPSAGDWYQKYSIDIKEGLDHCAAKSIAFHYVKDDAMKRLFALLYHICPPETYPEKLS